MTELDSPTIWDKEILELTSGRIPRRAIALLTGFEVEGPAISIGPIKIRRADDPLDQVLRRYQASLVKGSVLELRYLERQGRASTYAEPAMLLERSFIAVQVAVDSWVGMSQVHHFSEEGDVVDVTGSKRHEVADSWHPTDQPTISADATFRKKFLLAIQGQSRDLGPSLRRFSRACSEVMEESIIDFVVVLDALLGRGIHDEITHRVAARGALLLAPKIEDRPHYYRALKYIYGVRSALVHGRTEELPRIRPIERESLAALGVSLEGEAIFDRYHIADFARQIARRTLLAFLGGPARLDTDWLVNLELGLV